ncbi:hypothetical protein [Mammaliicoccus sciuri]|uniref:hypothetical protein n=1 Tax=Mammaliicoccus sciuri TaxID=1296 RepID=UPI0008075E03|nr:hypothetical protein [Mammaliicoccus sciuri]OCA12703.1 hypothetical protein BBD66_07775 [Mammaliicoccus sciuri]
MEFKHEKILKSRLLDLEFDTWEEVHQFKREYDELEEVYIKAKAWDKYLESTVIQEAIDEFGEGDPRVDYAVELTERLYKEE